MEKGRQTILFQGDSITDGARGRSDDPNHILGHGYVFLIAAELGVKLADRPPHIVNRGISGDRASDLYARWNEDALALRPDLISILVGVNDVLAAMNADPRGATDRFARSLRHVLEETAEKLPDTGLVLVEPFVLPAGAPAREWDRWQERIEACQHTVRELAQAFNAVHVPTQPAFDLACEQADAAYWLWDGVHPTAAGHGLLAQAWLEAVQQSPLALS
jgi:lysophospholipase L1-like esterase